MNLKLASMNLLKKVKERKKGREEERKKEGKRGRKKEGKRGRKKERREEKERKEGREKNSSVCVNIEDNVRIFPKDMILLTLSTARKFSKF